MTTALDSRHASATEKPIPDEPPMMRTRASESFELYLVASAMVMKIARRRSETIKWL